MVPELLLLVLLLIFLKVFLFKSKSRKMFDKIPGPKPYPLVGNIFDFDYPREETATTLKKMSMQYGPVFVVWLGTEPMVCIRNPADIESVLANKKVVDKPQAFKAFHPWVNRGLFTSEGDEWRKQRKLLAPAFYPSILQTFVPVYQRSSSLLIDKLAQSEGQEVDIAPLVGLYSFDVICETALKNTNLMEKSKVLKAFDELTFIVAQRNFSVLQKTCLFHLLPVGRRHNQLVSYLHGVTEKIIKYRKEKLLTNNEDVDSKDNDIGIKQKRPFMDLLLEFNAQGAGLTDLEIRMQVDTFMVAGYDTTQSAISFTLYCLSQHQHEQELAYEEVKSIFKDPDQDTSYQDLQEMRYMDKVIKESLRLYSVTRIVGRTSREQLTLKSGYTIPANTDIMVLVDAMHLDPEIYPDPLKFNPERFENESHHPFAYLPFGGGPRECIGKRFASLSMKSVISRVLLKYQLLPSNIPLTLRSDIILRSSSGVYLRAQPR